MQPILRACAITLSTTFFVACGGDNDTPTVNLEPTPPVTVTPTPIGTPAPTSTPTASPTGTPSLPQTNIILEEMHTGFCGVEGAVENDNAGYTASGYSNTANALNASVTWKVTAASSANYTLSWTYASASGDRDGSVTINSATASNVAFAPTGAWTTWATASISLPLAEGENTIVLSATTTSGLPNIDSLNVSGAGIAPATCDGSVVANYEIAPDPNPACSAGSTFENQVIDCRGARVGLSCSGDSETQPPVFTLKNATIKNVILAASGASDGIHCSSGNCILENVIWEDICEDAATNKSTGGTMTVTGGWAFNENGGWGGKPDKIFQHNSLNNSTTTINGGFTAKGTNGKLYRSCGNCSTNGGPRHVILDNVNIEGDIGSVVGINSNAGYDDTATITNLKIEGYSSGSPPVCIQYVGVLKSEGDSTKIGERWDDDNCIVSRSDVSAL